MTLLPNPHGVEKHDRIAVKNILKILVQNTVIRILAMEEDVINDCYTYIRFGSVLIVDLYFSARCPDQGLENVKNRKGMSSAGWNLNDVRTTTESRGKATRTCGVDTFWGYNYGNDAGKISYIFKGHGNAILNFDNCLKKGTTKVYLNKDRIGSASRIENKQINFTYTPGDTLRIKEVGQGIFIIHALKISCNGKTASTGNNFVD